MRAVYNTLSDFSGATFRNICNLDSQLEQMKLANELLKQDCADKTAHNLDERVPLTTLQPAAIRNTRGVMVLFKLFFPAGVADPLLIQTDCKGATSCQTSWSFILLLFWVSLVNVAQIIAAYVILTSFAGTV